tara:strand:- start:2833 stop:3057 length:225 start_codon:yes stop_codon:yes gene_type:complete
MGFAMNVKKKKKSSYELYGDLRRRGYDRCRRGFASVYGILYEQKRVGAGREFARPKDRKQRSERDIGKHGRDDY